MKISNIMIAATFAVILIPLSASAHPGGTDSSGGHHCWTDCESWGLQTGEYHYKDASDNIIQTYDKNENIFDRKMAERLHGQILLQVEEHGEAYYIRSNDSMRYYMKDGAIAYEMMRFFSLGITDVDLAKIPSVVDTTEMNESTSICSSNALANRLRGEILLQVEQHGEAWYVDPDTCRTIYMEDGAAAYEIMRFLGLGILNADLIKIPIGTTEFTESAEVIETPSEEVSIEGSGQEATNFFQLEEGLVVFTMQHSGDGHFAMTLMEEDGSYIGLLANEIGSFSGEKATRIETDGNYLIDVSASGTWSVTINQPHPSSSQVGSVPVILNGSGQSVSEYINLAAGLSIFELTHSGDSNFIVYLLNDEGEYIDLLVNEIGNFDGSTSVSISSSDVYLMDIAADGDWSISIK